MTPGRTTPPRGEGGPAVGGTAYRLCFYNDSGGRIGQVKVDTAGSTCGNVPCWRSLGASPPDGTGFLYRGENQQLRLRGGTGRSKLLYKATGTLAAGFAMRLMHTTRPTVQLVADDGPACFSLTMPRVVVGQQRLFKAKT